MRLITDWGRLLPILAFAVLLFAGCSSSPPCNVEPVQVDQARADYDAAAVAAEQADAEAEALEAQIAETEAKIVSDAELAEMKEHLYELKKGSGR